MISKRIDRKPESDNYRRLAEYIADADHEGEKSLVSWVEGCLAGDDYDLGIQEVEATQTLNVRTNKEKTYHLIVSFRPADEARLTPEMLREIEAEFAEALGFAEHQRHCGVHKNTNNVHMHVAYNMIHPEKLTRHEPFRDYWKRDKVCRALEHKYGLSVDNGRDQEKPEHEKRSEKAARMESHSGQESFESYVKARHERIMTALDAATNWQELHVALAGMGLVIKPRGNGLVIAERGGKTAIKGSALDRGFSKKRLETRLCLWQPPDAASLATEAIERYDAAPLHRAAERGNLYQEYKAGIDARKERLRSIKEDEDQTLEASRRRWADKRQELKGLALTRQGRARLLATAKFKEREELSGIRDQNRARREIVKNEVPYATWAGFLRLKAAAGDEVALAILRSRGEEVQPERDAQEQGGRERPASPSAGAAMSGSSKAAIWDNYFATENDIMQATDLRGASKRRLVAVAKMQRLAALEAAGELSLGNGPVLAGMRHEINARGVIIYHLAGGGTIRDTGKEIHFSAWDADAAKAAEAYAQAKWGKGVRFDPDSRNTFRRPLTQRQRQELENLGIAPRGRAREGFGR
jgi:hypothetical protein